MGNNIDRRTKMNNQTSIRYTLYLLTINGLVISTLTAMPNYGDPKYANVKSSQKLISASCIKRKNK